MNKAYVYALLVDGVVRYIGKGRDDRAREHVWVANSVNRRRQLGQKVRTTKFYNRLAKALLAGATVSVEFIADGLSDEDAFAREIVEIQNATGIWNTAPGGEGHTSETAKAQWTDKFRAHMGRLSKERWEADPERRQKQSEWARQVNSKLWSEDSDFRQKQSARVKAECESPERRKVLSDAARAMWTDEFRGQRSSQVRRQMVERWSVDGARESRSAQSREMWADPEFKERNRSAIQAALSRDDQRERVAKQAKERWSDPAYKARVSQRISEGRRRKSQMRETRG